MSGEHVHMRTLLNSMLDASSMSDEELTTRLCYRSQIVVSRWREGLSTPPIERLFALATIFGDHPGRWVVAYAIDQAPELRPSLIDLLSKACLTLPDPGVASGEA